MSQIEKLAWIPRLLDAYAEIKKTYDAQLQQQQGAEGPPIPESSQERKQGQVAIHAETTPVSQPATVSTASASSKRRRSVKRPALQRQVQETRRQLARLEVMQQHLRDIQNRLDKQLAGLEKRVAKGGSKPPQPGETPSAPTLFPRTNK
ncbi:MAG: hypothetical protein WCC10_15845 [Tumebacillaceae bacterium]